jgi:hypothetical protein
MARKKILRSQELFIMKLNNAIEQRKTYETLNEMKNRVGLQEDVKQILAASESEVYEKLSRLESQVSNWAHDQLMKLLKEDETIRQRIVNSFPHDPQFKMVDGKLVEATYVEGAAEDDE